MNEGASSVSRTRLYHAKDLLWKSFFSFLANSLTATHDPLLYDADVMPIQCCSVTVDIKRDVDSADRCGVQDMMLYA